MSKLGSRLTLVVAFLVTCALVVPSWAQDENNRRRRGGQDGGRQGGAFGRGFGGGGSLDKLALLRSEQVRTELKVTEEQKTKVDELATASREGQRALFEKMRGLRDASDEERAKIQAEVDAARAKATAENDKQLASILDKEQSKRLGEIELQQQGVAAFSSASVVAALKISDEQAAKIKAAVEKGDADRRKLFEDLRGGGGGFEGVREKMAKLTADTAAAAASVLNDEQRKQLEGMKGKPFELDRAALRGGGGFGGRGGDGAGSGRGGQGRGGAGGAGGGRRRPGDDSEEI